MEKNFKRLLIGSGAIVFSVAAISSISYLISKELVTIALDREQPKIMRNSEKKLTGIAGWDEIREIQKTASEKLKSYATTPVCITAHDGETLIGHLYTCADAKRTILAMHGWRSSWCGDFGIIADFWHQNHCNVLYVEQRGQGESGGKHMGFGLIERFDCLDWISWLNENGFDSLPIYLAGISMGAATVLMAAGLELPANVCGVMADCAFTSPQDIWKHVVENNIHLLYTGIRARVINDLCRQRLHVDAGEASCLDAMKNCKIPVLFIHGTDDHFVPVGMTYENYKACAAPKRLFVVPGADHGMSYLVDQAGYEEVVRQFWWEHDGDLVK